MDDEHIREMFESLGTVTIRRMFGGKGIYHGGQIFAIELRDEILLKADEESAPLFADAGATRWTFETKKGKSVAMPYWSIPDEALDDPDMLAIWARRAYEAAVRLK